MKYSAVIVAAGKGSRSGLQMNKVYSMLDGRCVLEHSLDIFLNDSDCTQVICVVDVADFYHYLPHKQNQKIILASGGTTRQQSVLNGIAPVLEDVVMIHDGARPFITQEIIDRCKTLMSSHEAVCTCMPCTDTIKIGQSTIQSTLDRSTLVVAQTPQCFHTQQYYQLALKAMEENINVTDDCSILEWAGCKDIVVALGSSKNIKLTWPSDFEPEKK